MKMNEAFAKLSWYPKGMRQIIRQMTAENPSDRPSAVECLENLNRTIHAFSLTKLLLPVSSMGQRVFL
ncbi:nak protein kinase [Moniliophthora roreri]|nr:nak protein kinase [Moniliophthora roreri]